MKFSCLCWLNPFKTCCPPVTIFGNLHPQASDARPGLPTSQSGWPRLWASSLDIPPMEAGPIRAMAAREIQWRQHAIYPDLRDISL